MKKNRKVTAAISAAVYEFMRTQEVMVPETVAESVAPQAMVSPSLWAFTGRQRMMNMRQFVQMRSFRKMISS